MFSSRFSHRSGPCRCATVSGGPFGGELACWRRLRMLRGWSSPLLHLWSIPEITTSQSVDQATVVLRVTGEWKSMDAPVNEGISRDVQLPVAAYQVPATACRRSPSCEYPVVNLVSFDADDWLPSIRHSLVWWAPLSFMIAWPRDLVKSDRNSVKSDTRHFLILHLLLNSRDQTWQIPYPTNNTR